jgi:pimeloyl-ACP methyl ester carboxylesterase
MMLSLLVAAVVAAAPAVSTEIKAGSNDVLAGTLLQPAGKIRAAMVIIPGSGPTDRNGNNPAGIKAASYRKLAEALAERGIATVRIDKRGMFGSAAAGDPNTATFADYDADIRSWFEVTRKASGRRCVWVAGHSEGGLVAMRAAAGPNVCGVVLLAAPGEKLGETISKQLRANPANAPLLAVRSRRLVSSRRAARCRSKACTRRLRKACSILRSRAS